MDRDGHRPGGGGSPPPRRRRNLSVPHRNLHPAGTGGSARAYPSGLLHLIFPCDCCVTQKCAKDAKFGCWTIWSPSRSSRLRVRPAITPTHPQGKVKCSTSASCHLILETFVACWDGRHSGLTREDAKFGIIPCNAPSRPSRLRVRRRYSRLPLTRKHAGDREEGRENSQCKMTTSTRGQTPPGAR